MKHIRIFIGKLSVFGGEIFYIYLNKRENTYILTNILKILQPKIGKNSDKTALTFFYISARNIDGVYSLEPPRRGGSEECPQSMVLSRNKKNNVYSCKPQFHNIKVGFKGVRII